MFVYVNIALIRVWLHAMLYSQSRNHTYSTVYTMFTVGSEEADGRERFRQDFLGGRARNIVEEAIAFCSLFFYKYLQLVYLNKIDRVN